MAGVAGAGGALTASLWISAPWAALVGGGVAAISAVIASRARQLLDRQWEQRRELPDHIVLQAPAGGLPRVRSIADPVTLGVHPAEAHASSPNQLTASGLPPYIPRDVDEELRRAVHRGGLILIVGDSTAGKSRAAYEAIRSQAPDHLLGVPSGRDSLASVTATLSDSRRSILWLDDLERFLGPDGLTPAMVANLTTKTEHNTVIVATMRTSEYERFTPRAKPTLDDQGRSAWRASRDVVRRAHVITMYRLWSAAELANAEAFTDDPRITRALQQAKTFGIAETLAAGPELLRDWRHAWASGSHPRGAALVAAAVDCRRAGIDEPVPRDLLMDLHHHYLSARGGDLLRPEAVDDAWDWALHPVHGASSLLIPAGSNEQDPRYLAFDYLIDQPDHEPIPPETWHLLVARADQREVNAVASRAYMHVRTAFHAAIDSGVVDDIHLRAQAMADHGEYPQAIQLLTDALDQAGPYSRSPGQRWSLRHQIAFWQLSSGERIDEAEATFRELLAEAELTLSQDDEWLQVVRHNLASCARHRGDLAEALSQFRRILADRERQTGPDAMNTLATRGVIADIIAEMGDLTEALRQTRVLLVDSERVLGADHTSTLSTTLSLAHYLAQTGEPGAAVDALKALVPDLARSHGADHSAVLEARSDLARYHAQDGNRSQAVRQLQEVIADYERIHGTDDHRVNSARQELEDLLAQPG